MHQEAIYKCNILPNIFVYLFTFVLFMYFIFAIILDMHLCFRFNDKLSQECLWLFWLLPSRFYFTFSVFFFRKPLFSPPKFLPHQKRVPVLVWNTFLRNAACLLARVCQNYAGGRYLYVIRVQLQKILCCLE